MAAASAIKGDESSETGHAGSQNNLPLKVEGEQDQFKSTTVVEKQSVLVENSKSQEKCDKVEPLTKRFVDAPLPATNAWTKRSASVTSAPESNQIPEPQFPEPKKEAALNDKTANQGNNLSLKAVKGPKVPATNVENLKLEKPKTQKSKTELNGGKPADNNHKTKIKKFGEDFVAAPLPTVNPWKKSAGPAVSSGLVPSSMVEQDPTPAAAAVVSPPSSFTKDPWLVEKPFMAEPKRDPKPLESTSTDTELNKVASPAFADENWPTLHEVKVTEPNQTMPPKVIKSPRVKAISTAAAASTTTTTSTTVTTTTTTEATTEATPVVSGIASAPAMASTEVDQSPAGNTVAGATDKQTVVAQIQNDSGGEDSSKENKDSTTEDDTNNIVKSKKGTKPKWQRMEIDHPKPDRRNRRSRSQGRGYSPPRRGGGSGRPAGDRFNRPNNRRSDGPDSHNWRANMTPQPTTTPADAGAAPDATTFTDAAHAATNNIDGARGGTALNFTGNRNTRGRGALRGNPLRRGGGRGRGGLRETKSPPFQSNVNSWNPDQVFPVMNPEAEAVPVPWSQGFNRVHTIPRVPPPISPAVVLGVDANLLFQEHLLNILGQASVYYDVASTTYTPTPSETLRHQVEYYFSEDNLVKDLYLRKKMDKQGWVKLDLVLSFNKVKELKADHKSLIQAIRGSDKLELSEHEDYVRTLNYPESWPVEDDQAIQRVAAMSTLHSDAPEFVPGKPFVLRNLVSSRQESIPAPREGDDVPQAENQPTSAADGEKEDVEDKENVLSATASNLSTLSPIVPSR